MSNDNTKRIRINYLTLDGKTGGKNLLNVMKSLKGEADYKFVNTLKDDIIKDLPAKTVKEEIDFPVVEVPAPHTQFVSSTIEIGNLTTTSTERSAGRKNVVTGRLTQQFQLVDTTTVTSVSNTRKDVTSVTVSKLIPFMRAKRIYFECSGMKPNARLYAFFDDVNVSDLCRTTNDITNNNYKHTIVTSELGKVKGYFDLPAGRFKGGVRTFELRDVIDKTRDAVSTFARAKYHSQGIQSDTTLTTNITTVTNRQTNTVTSERLVNMWWSDPIAQSFVVDTAGTPHGFFLSSVDLFFSSVGYNDRVVVEVRPVTNGYPNTNKVYEYASVELHSSQIKTSSDASIATNFKFATPLFLPNNTEYCFVVMCNTEETSVFISELGKRNLRKGDTLSATGEPIMKQPYLGSMFISQNRTTWVSEQTKDIKFRLYRCQFENTGAVRFVNDTVKDGMSNHIKLMRPNCLRFTEGSAKVTVSAIGHGMKENDKFMLSFGSDVPETMLGIPRSVLEYKTLTVTEVDSTSFSFVVTTNANATGESGGKYNTVIGYNIAYNAFTLRMKYTAVDNTDLVNKFVGKSINSYNMLPKVSEKNIINEVLTELDEQYVMKNGGDGGLQLITVLNTQHRTLSPIIESHAVGVTTECNLITNDDKKSPALYIQKNVELSNPSNKLKIFFDYNKPFGTNIIVEVLLNKITDIDYYNTKEEEWIRVNPLVEMNTHSSNDVTNNANYEYKSSGSFNSFAVRIRFTSDNIAIVPYIANYRAIALLDSE